MGDVFPEFDDGAMTSALVPEGSWCLVNPMRLRIVEDPGGVTLYVLEMPDGSWLVLGELLPYRFTASPA